MPDEEAPPVVAVVVASDPGPWFEECLAALGAQDYLNLSVLVLDAASEENPASRVAAVLPQAYLRRLERNEGFGASANDALAAVQGASHLVLCHDDVAPAPDAVRRMVEEAFRSNAGVVAPKLVAWNDPGRLLQVGLDVDRFASPVPRVEVGEIDQSQHDEVREVFAAPGGCTLVRADLFETLGGYDREISLLGEDVDLCWRAQVAGARVVVAPQAVVRHLEATAGGVRAQPDKRPLQRRHEIRTVLKNYGPIVRYPIAAQLALLGLLEVVYCIATGDRSRAREVAAAWRWNLSPSRRLRPARRALRRSRRLPDRMIIRQLAPSRRVGAFLRGRVAPALAARGSRGSAAEPPGARIGADKLAGALGRPLGRGRRRAEATIVTAALVIVVVFGARSLIGARLPLVGGLAPFPSATSLLSHFFGGWEAAGLQQSGPAPLAFGLLGGAGLLLGGAMGALQQVVLFGSVAVGALGAARLVAPFGSSRAKLVAAVAYVAMPLVWNDLARGDLPAMVGFAAMPFVLLRLAQATQLAPFRTDRPMAAEVAGLGVLLAVSGAFVPVLVPVSLASAFAMVIGSLLAGELRATSRAFGVAAGGCAVAVALDLPWSLSLFTGGARWSILSGALGATSARPGLGELMRFDTGPLGKGLLSWGFLAAAALALLIARGPRLRFATRWWAVALGSFAVAWFGAEGWLGQGGSASSVFLAPAAAALAATVALGIAAFEQDLASYRFGWRQVATAAAALCAVAGIMPWLGATVGGRFSLPANGYDQVLGWMDATSPPRVPYRVLWLGDPSTLPLRSWQIAPGYAFGVSQNGLPQAVTALWPASSPGPASAVVGDVSLAREGLTVDLGRLLAPLGVRYVVIPSTLAPVLPGIQSAEARPAPAGLLSGLAIQEDLHELPSQAGSYVFVNEDWSSGDGSAVLPAATSPPLTSIAWAAAAFEIVLVLGAVLIATRRRSSVLAPAGGSALRAAPEPPDPPGSPRVPGRDAPPRAGDPAPVLVGGDGQDAALRGHL